MEDQENIYSVDIDQEEESLLSYKLKDLTEKSMKYSSKSTFQTEGGMFVKGDRSFQTKNTIQTAQTKIFEFENHATLENQASHKLKRDECFIQRSCIWKQKTTKSKRKVTNISGKFRKRHTDVHQLQFKFIQISVNNGGRYKMIFEPRPNSILDLDGDGIILLQDGRWMEGNWIDGSPNGQFKLRCPNSGCSQEDIQNYKSHCYGYGNFFKDARYDKEIYQEEPSNQGLNKNDQGPIVKQKKVRRGISMI